MTVCTAHSSRTGAPCKGQALTGAVVCRSHGAGAPQVREAAQKRLEAALPVALEQLIGLLTTADQDSVRLRAMDLVMERTLGKVTDKLKLSGDSDAPLEIIVSRPASSPSADQTSST